MQVYTLPARGRRDNVVSTSFCPSQRRRRCFSNETPNDVLVVHRQEVSVVRLHDVTQERCSDVSNIPNCKVSSKSQMKHRMKSRW